MLLSQSFYYNVCSGIWQGLSDLCMLKRHTEGSSAKSTWILSFPAQLATSSELIDVFHEAHLLQDVCG